MRPPFQRRRVIIPTDKRKGQNPGMAGIYRALAKHEKRQTHPEAAEAAHADSATLAAPGISGTVIGAEIDHGLYLGPERLIDSLADACPGRPPEAWRAAKSVCAAVTASRYAARFSCSTSAR